MEKSESFIFFTKVVIHITQNLMGSKVDQDPPPPFFMKIQSVVRLFA